MPPSREKLSPVEEEDLQLRQPNEALEEENFHHPAAVRQPSTHGEELSGSTLRVHTNLTQPFQSPESIKRCRNSPTTGPNKPEAYIDMLYEYDCIPLKYKLFAACSLWLLLFGFVLFSGTFTTFKLDTAEEVLISKIENMPMFVFGILFCGASSCALIYLSWRWKENSIWLVERILLPGFTNSATGLGNTLINVGTVHHWEVSATAKSTIIITSIYLGVFTVPLIWYSFSLWRMRGRQEKNNEMP